MKLVASTGLIVFLLLAVYSQLTDTSVTIVHRLTKKTVFNSSDEIQVKRVTLEDVNDAKISFMLMSVPLDACQIPNKPPQISRERLKSTGLDKETRWILLCIPGGGCDLKTKIINAAQANFSHVFVKGTELDNLDDLKEDPDVGIDVTLLTSSEWDTIAAFAYPKPYYVSITRSKKDEGGFWIDNIIFRTVYWLYCIIVDILGGTFGWIYAIAIGILVIPKRWKEYITYDQKKCLAVVFFLGVLSTPFVIFELLAKARKQDQGEQQNKRKEGNQKTPSWTDYSWDWDKEGSESVDERTEEQKLETWLQALEMKVPLAQLTKQKVEKKFRSMAARFHPDKHQNVDEETKKQITTRFQRMEAAKRNLLGYLEKRDKST